MSKTKLWKSLNEAYRSMLNEGQMNRLDYATKEQKPYVSLVDGEWILIGADGKDVHNYGKGKDAQRAAQADMKKLFEAEKDCKPDFPDVDKDGDKEECIGEDKDAYNRLAKYVDLWFDTYEFGTEPRGHEWANFMADYEHEMSDDKGLPLMVRGGIMWANAKAKALSKK